MDIEKKLQRSIDLYLDNFLIIFSTCFVGTLLSAVSLGILAGPILGGTMVLILKLIKNKPTQFREIFSHFDKYLPTTLISLPAFFLIILLQRVPVIGSFLSIALSPFILVIMTFAVILIIEKKLPPLPALFETITFIKTDPLIIWIYALIALILSAIGAVAFGVGIFLTIPFSIICMAVVYQDYSDQRRS